MNDPDPGGLLSEALRLAGAERHALKAGDLLVLRVEGRFTGADAVVFRDLRRMLPDVAVAIVKTGPDERAYSFEVLPKAREGIVVVKTVTPLDESTSARIRSYLLEVTGSRDVLVIGPEVHEVRAFDLAAMNRLGWHHTSQRPSRPPEDDAR